MHGAMSVKINRRYKMLTVREDGNFVVEVYTASEVANCYACSRYEAEAKLLAFNRRGEMFVSKEYFNIKRCCFIGSGISAAYDFLRMATCNFTKKIFYSTATLAFSEDGGKDYADLSEGEFFEASIKLCGDLAEHHASRGA
jgi:hypothetical protein